MDNDSVNTQPPDFGPTQPNYPHLAQLVRVTSPSIGGNVYPAITQQFVPPLGIRDREPCYVYEPNNILLSPGIYDCRLVSNYLSLPLYATTCCLTVPFSSSSSSSASRQSVITRANRGSVSGSVSVVAGLSVPSVTAAAPSLLVLSVGVVSGTPTVTATWNGYTFTAGPTINLPAGGPLAGSVFLFYLPVAAGATSNVSLSFSGAGFAFASVAQITNLASLAIDKTSSENGLFTIADTGPTGSIDFSNEYIHAAFLMINPGTYSWLNGFTGGGQDVSATVTGLTVALADGYNVSSFISSFTGELSTSPTSWAGLIGTFS